LEEGKEVNDTVEVGAGAKRGMLKILGCETEILEIGKRREVLW